MISERLEKEKKLLGQNYIIIEETEERKEALHAEMISGYFLKDFQIIAKIVFRVVLLHLL